MNIFNENIINIIRSGRIKGFAVSLFGISVAFSALAFAYLFSLWIGFFIILIAFCICAYGWMMIIQEIRRRHGNK